MTFSFEFAYEYFPLFNQPVITTSDSISGNVSVTVYPNWYNSINLVWSYPASWGSVRSLIYHSAVEGGEYKKLTPSPLSPGVNSLNDVTTQDFSKIYEGWYIVEAILPNGKRIQSVPVTWRNKRSDWVQIRANEINRREWFLLNNYVGVTTYLFNRKTYGKRCDNCWDYTVEKVVKDKCETCFGTSFDGGYWSPMKTKMQYEATPNDISLGYFGKFEQNETMVWTIAYPPMNTRDLIYRIADGKLFEIIDFKQTELQTVPVRQLAKITELDKESPEYKVVLANNLIPH